MSKIRINISVFFLAVAVSAILGSLAHYHSEGLECLDHGTEQHYAETDPVCPICSLVTDFDIDNTDGLEHELTFKEFLVPSYSIFYTNYIHSAQRDRAPPHLI